MANAPLRAVIFDIGRVLVKLDLARAIAGLSQGISLSPAELWSAIEKDPRWHEWPEGRNLPPRLAPSHHPAPGKPSQVRRILPSLEPQPRSRPYSLRRSIRFHRKKA